MKKRVNATATLWLLIAFGPSVALATPVSMRHPEGTSHGVLVLTDESGAKLADGELSQWPERRGTMASRMTIRFKDGS